jgi:hypothetical protein
MHTHEDMWLHKRRTAAVAVQVLEDILDGQSLLRGHSEDLGHALDDVRRVLRYAQEPTTKMCKLAN